MNNFWSFLTICVQYKNNSNNINNIYKPKTVSQISRVSGNS